ncbi:MAG: hypothetical protein EA381_01365 [Planctomycetaceae bacterium]|nr:MAG: hypothetical protein EA381_01365 [Planctomycetaceae bacterium]
MSTIARNGSECRAGLSKFAPDLLVMELNVFWSGYEGVMATLIDDPQLNEIPVVFFTEFFEQSPLEENPRIIAQLKHPFQTQELSRLRLLLDEMEAARAVNSLCLKQRGQLPANCQKA